MNMTKKCVAFIPARSGSKRIPNKNIMPLRGHPLLAYSISAATQSAVFDAVICVTDSQRYADIARHYGAEVPRLRPTDISGDTSSDIEWVLWILEVLKEGGQSFDAFSILRPTSPFRLPQTICRAWETFSTSPDAHSLRAVQKCTQHPGKMWVIENQRMSPLFPFKQNGVPWHSRQYAALPEIYAQDASLEIARTSVPLELGSIAGSAIIPFVSQNHEGFDINHPEDWVIAEHLIETNAAQLPSISKSPFDPDRA